MFTSGQTVDCLPILVNPDVVLELDETFSVTLSSDDPAVMIGRDSATVTITNDDST